MSRPKKSVKLVPMRSEDIERLQRVCESLGMPFRELISILANKGGELVLLSNGKLDEVIVLFKALKGFSRLGFTLFPCSILNKVAEASGDFVEEMKRLGKMIGAIYAMNEYASPEELRGVVSMVFLDASQVSLRMEERKLRIAVAVPGRSEATIRLSISFLDGFLEELGYVKDNEDVNSGLVILDYVKR